MSETFSNNRLRMGVLVGALLLAFAAQYLYTGELLTRSIGANNWEWEPRYTLASLFLLVAIGGAAWALAGAPGDFAVAQLSTAASRPLTVNKTTLWLALAAGCYVFSIVLYWNFGENLLVQALWLGGIACLVVPFLRTPAVQTSDESVPWWQWLAVLALTVLGFILRYWHLTEIPSHVDNDIALMGSFGSQLIDAGNYNWIGASGSGHLLSYDQFLAWSMRLFGENHYGLVMSSVILGTLTLPLVFLLGRLLFNWRVGFVAMALLTANYTHIQFSRILFGAEVTFFVTLTFYLMFLGLKTNQRHWFAWAGLASSFSILFYDSGRVVPVIVIVVVSWCLLWQTNLFFSNFKNWCLFGLGALVGFGPMLGFAFKDFGSFVGRGNSVTIFSPEIFEHEVAAYQRTTFIDVVLEQINHTFLTFHLYGDRSPHFTFPWPMVAPLTAALLVIGVGCCLWRIRDLRFFTLLAWIGLTFILGGVLTYDPPYWPHLNIVLPAVVIIAGLAADAALELLSPPSQLISFLSLRLVGLGLLVYSGYNNWQVYTTYVQDNADPRIRLARYLDQFPTGYQVYLVSEPLNWNDYAFQFFDKGVVGQDATIDELESAPPAPDRPLLFILMDHQEEIEKLQQHYPSGRVEEHEDSYEDIAFASLEVTPPGYVFHPRPRAVNPATLPGWWIIAALVALLAATPLFRRFRPRPTILTPTP